ncbi:hypothetical protein HPB52_013558 [Rhipicephalus sanguineus]|uniref:Uncharacterized protein n=1 Tax=Rhipicephalus sanguineus TaxID=34632 RepID=A0A9D4PWE0_RHISA|nr:hypothetical protein HPB52_013558 [Rhipicephalus sanguineus]
MAPMPPLSGLSAADNAGSHRGSPPASAAASRAPPTASTSGSSLLLRGVLTASSAGRYFVWNPSNASDKGLTLNDLQLVLRELTIYKRNRRVRVNPESR